MRENDEWKRKEKSGENREIHCSHSRLYLYNIYLPLIRLVIVRVIYIYTGKDRENIHTYYRIYYVLEERIINKEKRTLTRAAFSPTFLFCTFFSIIFTSTTADTIPPTH